MSLLWHFKLTDLKKVCHQTSAGVKIFRLSSNLACILKQVFNWLLKIRFHIWARLFWYLSPNKVHLLHNIPKEFWTSWVTRLLKKKVFASICFAIHKFLFIWHPTFFCIDKLLHNKVTQNIQEFPPHSCLPDIFWTFSFSADLP